MGANTRYTSFLTGSSDQGVAIIMISSELPEILGMSDRILVIHQGEINGEPDAKTATQEQILYLAAGYNKLEGNQPHIISRGRGEGSVSMDGFKSKQENEAKGKKGSGSFGKLNAATRRAIYSFGILAGLFLLFSVLQVDKFLAPANLQNLLQQIVTYTIIGCGLTFCLVCGGNDLSAGASMALSGIIMVSLLTRGCRWGVCIVLCLAWEFVPGS